MLHSPSRLNWWVSDCGRNGANGDRRLANTLFGGPPAPSLFVSPQE